MLTCLIYMVDKDTVPLSSLFLWNQKYKLILHTQLSRPFHRPKSRCEIRMKQRNLFFFQGSLFTFSGRFSDIQGAAVVFLTEALGAAPLSGVVVTVLLLSFVLGVKACSVSFVSVNHHNDLLLALNMFPGIPPLSIPVRLCHKHSNLNPAIACVLLALQNGTLSSTYHPALPSCLLPWG